MSRSAEVRVPHTSLGIPSPAKWQDQKRGARSMCAKLAVCQACRRTSEGAIVDTASAGERGDGYRRRIDHRVRAGQAASESSLSDLPGADESCSHKLGWTMCITTRWLLWVCAMVVAVGGRAPWWLLSRGQLASTSAAHCAHTKATSTDVPALCETKPADAVLYHCGHRYACLQCAHYMRYASMCCPVCRAPIDDVVRIFECHE